MKKSKFTESPLSETRTNEPALQGAVWIVLILMAGAAFWGFFRVFTGICLEDALITYRYAENLALGNGFVFNEGERVLGTTTPLYTMVLAFLALPFGTAHIPLISNVILVLVSMGSGILLFVVLRKADFSVRTSLIALVLFVFHPSIVWTTAGGMETPLVIFFMVLSLYVLESKRWLLVGVACSLLILTRIDGVVWAGMVVVCLLMTNRRALPRTLLAGSAILVPWFIFAILYFGSMVPYSVSAKVMRSSDAFAYLPDPRLARAYFNWFLNAIGIPSTGGYFAIDFPIWCAFTAAGVAAILRQKQRRPLIILIVFPVAFGLVYFLGRAPMTFQWYLVPVTWCGLVLASIGIVGADNFVADYFRSHNLPPRVSKLVLAFLVAIIGLGLLELNVESFKHHYKHQVNENGTRRRIGEWLRVNTDERATVAMEAIGYQGALSKRRVIDLAGLISPEVVRIKKESNTNAEVYYRVFSQLRPDYLVLRSFEVEDNKHYYGGPTFENDLQREYFLANYELVEMYKPPLSNFWKFSIALYKRV